MDQRALAELALLHHFKVQIGSASRNHLESTDHLLEPRRVCPSVHRGVVEESGRVDAIDDLVELIPHTRKLGQEKFEMHVHPLNTGVAALGVHVGVVVVYDFVPDHEVSGSSCPFQIVVTLPSVSGDDTAVSGEGQQPRLQS